MKPLRPSASRACPRPRALLCALVLLAGCGAGRELGAGAEAAHKPPNESAVRLLVAGADQLKRGDRRALLRAKQTLEKAVRLEPRLWEAHYDLGLAHRRLGELEAARASLQTAHDLAEDAPEPIVALAECELQLGNAGAAERLLEQLVQRNPHDTSARLALSAVYRQREKPEQALAAAREVLVQNPRETRGLLEIGRIYRAQGELDVSQLVLEKARAIDDKNAAVHNELGLLSLERGDTQLAFTHFAAAQQAEASFAPAHINQGAVLLKAGDFEAAARAYRAALKAAPDAADARVGLAIALRGQGKHKQAQKEYERVLAQHPTHLAALFDLAVLKADFLDQRKDALRLFNEYLSLAPNTDSHRQTARRYVEDIQMALGTGP